MRRTTFLCIILLMAVGALAFRLPILGNRPFHGDEAVHAVKFSDLWLKGEYQYDSNEFHGPTIYYATLPAVWLRGRTTFAATTEADYRLPVAVLGAAMVLLLIPLSNGLGRRSAVWAALFTAISPAFVFYSRYYIQEVPLVLAALGFLACGWQYVQNRGILPAIGAGVCAGLMIASKETAVFSFVALGIAIGLARAWSRRFDGAPESTPTPPPLAPRDVAIALVAAALTACLFLCGIGLKRHGALLLPSITDWSAPLGYMRSYAPWFHRAHGASIHDHPWRYYLRILLWTHARGGAIYSEILIVGLAIVGTLFALAPQPNTKVGTEDGTEAALEGAPSFVRTVAFYTWTLTLIYSVIPYKTPWCLLNFLSGMILLAGIGAVSLIRSLPGLPLKLLCAALLLGASVHLGFQAYRGSFVDFTNPANPYVYAQPVREAAELGDRVYELSRSSPLRDNMTVDVISIDNYYWPLPWYLRRFNNVGYWTAVPANLDAPIVLASPEFEDQIQTKLGNTHIMNGYRSIRSGVFFEVWIRLDLWSAYLKTRKRDPND